MGSHRVRCPFGPLSAPLLTSFLTFLAGPPCPHTTPTPPPPHLTFLIASTTDEELYPGSMFLSASASRMFTPACAAAVARLSGRRSIFMGTAGLEFEFEFAAGATAAEGPPEGSPWG
jgi:hypothetical protein